MLTGADHRYLDLLKRCLTASIYDESGWRLALTDVQFRRGSTTQGKLDWMRERVLKIAAGRSWALVKTASFDRAKREEGRDWPLFGYTMVGHERLDHLQECIVEVVEKKVPGDLVETGVWRGGTLIFMRAMLQVLGDTDRTIWGCDSFEGLPKPTTRTDGMDLSHVDLLKVALEDVQENFRRFDLLDDQVRFLEGWFCDTLPTAPIETISILRLDGDLYSSTMDAISSLYDRVSEGGYVIIDDYHSWEPCHRAIHDFLDERNMEADIKTVDSSCAYFQVK